MIIAILEVVAWVIVVVSLAISCLVLMNCRPPRGRPR